MNDSFIELHARSAFSFLRGASHPEALVTRAAELQMPAIALVDRDGVYGSARAHARGKETGTRALAGAEITLEDGTALPLLVENRTGYQNLCRLITRTKLRAPKGTGAATWDELAEFSEGLIALTGDDEGPVRRALLTGDLPAAETALRHILRIFGPSRTYVELQRHLLRGELWLMRRLVHLATTHRLPYLATNGACYTRKAERPLLDAFTCLRHHTTLDEAGTLLSANAERYLKAPAQMAALFADLPAAIRETRRLADRLEFTLHDLGYEFPRYPSPTGESQTAILRRETFAGARRRYGKLTAAVRNQLEHELALIAKLGFCGYFLIVWQITEFARQQGILAQGRGSAANSAVCYSLGITNVDPVGGNLLFERFLSEGREGWPDIDIDLPSGDRREAIIQEVFRRYSPRGAAMTANVITYRGKSAMREMGKVLGLPEDVLLRFSGIGGHGDYRDTLELRERIHQSGLPDSHPRLPALLHLYHLAYGLPRHLGQHSGGMIVSDRPLDAVVPLENASMPGRVVVQWDKDDCEDLGIIKVDLLGLGMLAAIQDTLTVCEQRGQPVDLAQIPKDDPAVYDMLCRADTVGLFQVESRAQMATLPRLQPRKFYDIVIETGLIRPGPIVGNLVHPYLNRRAGREKVDYIDSRFEPALARTLGVPLFQEQVLKMAMLIADFSGSEAEELRRAMSFHRSEERMNRVMAKLRAAMDRKEVTPELQDRIITAIRSFAQYGFPESHAISFALIAYASAWLKVHRPAEFYTGLLNNQPMGFYSSATLVKDAQAHGIRIKPVCVQQSALPCTVEAERVIRLGLGQLKGFSQASAGQILEARQRQPFRDMTDFLLRTAIPRDERRILAQSGALNALAAHRRDALWQAEQPLEQGDLFSNAENRQRKAETGFEVGSSRLDVRRSALAAMLPAERLAADYQTLHLTTGPHPMKYLRPSLPEIWRASDLAGAENGITVWIGGLVICRQRPGTAKGHVFISLEDETGIANAFVPSPAFEAYRLVITQEPFLKIRGRIQNQDGVISVYTHHVESLPFEAVPDGHSHDFR